jgi:hypothetical protein
MNQHFFQKVCIAALIFISGCATLPEETPASGFEKQCTAYGFVPDSVEHAICIKRETRELRNYLERMEAEDKEKNESFYRDLERKRLGLDIK